MAKWLAKEFDWDTGRYTGRYYDIAEAGIVAVFVDSYFGNDANDGTDPDTPYKTLGAAITYLNANGANGSRIFMNGIFSENLPTQTYWYEFIGCGGGYNGKTGFYYVGSGPIITNTKPGSRYNNIILIGYNGTAWQSTNNAQAFIAGSIIQDTQINQVVFYGSMEVYYSIYRNVRSSGGSGQHTFKFYNSIVYDIYRVDIAMTIIGFNNFLKIHPDSLAITNNMTNSLTGVLGQFNNISLNDFSVRITSPLLFAGAIDGITGVAAHIGDVSVGQSFTGLMNEFTEEGGAVYTNITVDTQGRLTITAGQTEGTIVSAIIDLANYLEIRGVDIFNDFDVSGGEVQQGIFEPFAAPRAALAIEVKYGDTIAEVGDCPWLLTEYGKQPTYSGTGASRVGNAAGTYDPDNSNKITARYLQLSITLKDNS